MDQVKDLLFIHDLDTPCHLAVLANSIGINTHVVTSVDEAIKVNHLNKSLCLIPQFGLPIDSRGIPIMIAKLIAEMPVAIYQAQSEKIDENACVMLGVQGILHHNLSMDLLLTGLKKMLDGELWYDRNLLSKVVKGFVQNNESEGAVSNEGRMSMWQMLTLREKTIIKLVSSGARNKEIAHRLCISEHTVKAHISSIFRKTQSRNRVELLRWSNHNYAQLA